MSLKERSFVVRLRQPRRRRVIVVAILGCAIGAGTIGFVVSASRRGSSASVRTREEMPRTKEASAPVAPGTARGLRAALSRQPQAARMSLRLGERFSRGGLEVSMLEGTLAIGGQTRPVRIVRTQNDDGEEVEAFLTGASDSYKWSSDSGAQFNGRNASGSDKKLIERIALDSPDQFVFAQLRRASYRVVGQGVVPAGIVDLENYVGPVWDVIRIDEPDPDREQPRFYHINTSTGLIDKITSQEDGIPITAELSNWPDQEREKQPFRIQWRMNKQVVMELTFTRGSHGPRR